MDLVFALCTDLHFGPEALYRGKLRKLSAHAGPLLERFVRRMNDEVHPSLVLNLGDDLEDEGPEVDRARYGDVMRILGGVEGALAHVAGNHDTVHLSTDDLSAAWRTSSPRAIAPEAGAPLHYAFDHGGYRFVILHTHEVKDREISVGDEQLAWLAGELAALDKPCFVAMHHPVADQHLVGNRWFEGRANIALVRERKKLRALFEETHARAAKEPGAASREAKVLAVFNGHVHWNHLAVHAGIPYVSIQSLVENLDDDAPGRPAEAHAVVRVSRARVVVEVAGQETARYQFARE
jgi:Icc protein